MDSPETANPEIANPENANPGAVHVVDDDDRFRISLTRVLNASGVKAVGYRNAEEFLRAAAAAEPGCLLLDISMPGPSGMELLDALASRELPPPIIFVTACDDVPTSVHALKAGALDFITKPVDTAALLKSIHRALQVDAERRAAHSEKEDLCRRYEELTRGERAVFAGVIRGTLNKQLAATLYTCERTIKNHRANLMVKMGAKSIVDLVRMGRLLGLWSAATQEIQETSL